MSEAKDQFGLLRQSADGRVVDAMERLVDEAPDYQLVPHQSAGVCREVRSRRRGDCRGLPPRRPHRHIRHRLERALPRLRRRARHERHAEDRAEGRVYLLALRLGLFADAGRDGRRHLHGQPARAQDRGPQSRRSSADRVFSPDVLGFRRRRPGGGITRNWSTSSCSTMSSLRRAKRECWRSNCRPNSSSSSSRSPIRRSSSTSRANRPANARPCP